MEMNVKGAAVPGQVHSLKNPVKVNPKRWHCAVQGNEGPRLLLVGPHHWFMAKAYSGDG